MQLALDAFKQFQAQLYFTMLQDLGGSRLRNIQQLRCPTDRARLHDGMKNFYMTQTHGVNTFSK
jgi:hypothetical protein